MTAMELVREIWFWGLAVGLPGAALLGFAIAAITTPLPERGKRGNA
jgi:hypothetical protein